MSRRIALSLIMILVPFLLRAQSATRSSQDELVTTLLARIEKLEKRVAELEQSKAEASGTPVQQSMVEKQANVVSVEEAAHEQHAAIHGTDEVGPERFPSMKLRGFGDLVFAATDQPGSKSGFSQGQFILHIASPLSKRIAYFGEVSFTAQPSGYNLDLERALIRFDYNDALKLSFGRYHTPINYWNTAFHHGLWLQTTISRPEMIRFGGRFQPVHFLGLQSEGNIPSGWMGLGYNVGVGNGRAALIARPGDPGDVNNNRAWLVNLFSRPTGLHGLQFGGSLYRDLVSPSPALPGNPQFGEWIATAHLVWTRETPEFLAEFANVRHRNQLTQATYTSQGGYVQLAYRLPWHEKKWKPYYRFDFINTPIGEPLFSTGDPNTVVKDFRGSTAGLRYDISDFVALKGEYRNGKKGPGDPRIEGVFMQTSFTF